MAQEPEREAIAFLAHAAQQESATPEQSLAAAFP
jgi:hypothetical protein